MAPETQASLAAARTSPKPRASITAAQPGDYVYYKVNVDTISLGSEVVQDGAQIMTDTGAVGIYPPNNQILEKLHSAAPVKKDCSNRDTLPPLTLTINGTAVVIPVGPLSWLLASNSLLPHLWPRPFL